MTCACGHPHHRHCDRCTCCTGPGRCQEDYRSVQRRCLNTDHKPCPCNQFQEKVLNSDSRITNARRNTEAVESALDEVIAEIVELLDSAPALSDADRGDLTMTLRSLRIAPSLLTIAASALTRIECRFPKVVA